MNYMTTIYAEHFFLQPITTNETRFILLTE